MKTVADMTAKMLKGLQGAQPAYLAGIRSVTQAPGQAAAAKADVWKQKMQEVIADGRWEQAVASVPLESWRRASEQAAGKLASSAQVAATKWSEFAQSAQPVWEQSRMTAKSMASGTTEDAIAKVRMNIEMMKTLKGKKFARR